MKPSQIGTLSREYYIEKSNIRSSCYEKQEISTESILYDDDMCGISVCVQFDRITGIRIHSTTRIQTVGKMDNGSITYFPIQVGGERINRIRIWTPSFYFMVSFALRSPAWYFFAMQN